MRSALPAITHASQLHNVLQGWETTLLAWTGSGAPATNPPLKPHSPVQCNYTFTRTPPPTGSRDRTHPGSPGPGAAEPRWHLLLGFSPENGAHPPVWGPATPLAGWQAMWWRLLKAHLCCRKRRVGSPEEIVTFKVRVSPFRYQSFAPQEGLNRKKYLRLCSRTALPKDPVEGLVPP